MTPELEETVLKTVNVVGHGVLGIDLMENPNTGLVVHEVNGTVEFKGAQSATEYSIAGRIVDYVTSNRSKIDTPSLNAQ